MSSIFERIQEWHKSKGLTCLEVQSNKLIEEVTEHLLEPTVDSYCDSMIVISSICDILRAQQKIDISLKYLIEHREAYMHIPVQLSWSLPIIRALNEYISALNRNQYGRMETALQMLLSKIMQSMAVNYSASQLSMSIVEEQLTEVFDEVSNRVGILEGQKFIKEEQ